MPPCIPKSVPSHLTVEAAKRAVGINPQNAVPENAIRGLASFAPMKPEHLALLTSRKWGQGKVDLGVTFIDTINTTLKSKILLYANKWSKFGNIRFRESARGEVRLSLAGDGYWSYLGTDILSIPGNQPTLNLQQFSLNTPDSEFDRVVCHEFGHTCGFPHEHERAEILNLLDFQKTVAYFATHVGWDEQTVREQIFSPLDPATLTANAADSRSIMCYEFDGACTKSGQPIPGGNVIDANDAALVGKIYPPVITPPVPPTPPTGGTGSFSATGSGTVRYRGSFGDRETPVSFSNLSLTLAPPAKAPEPAASVLSTHWPEIVKLGGKILPVVIAGIMSKKTPEQIAADLAALAIGSA